jgi:CheY-like chemotaxis protein
MSHRRAVLVLEADPMRQLGFRGALSAAGYDVVCAAAVADAVELAGRQGFHVILLGPDEPPPTGSALPSAATPVVALAKLPDCVIGRTISAGMKPPADLPEILEALTRYMRFAPERHAGNPADLDRLVSDWANYEQVAANDRT